MKNIADFFGLTDSEEIKEATAKYIADAVTVHYSPKGGGGNHENNTRKERGFLGICEITYKVEPNVHFVTRLFARNSRFPHSFIKETVKKFYGSLG